VTAAPSGTRRSEARAGTTGGIIGRQFREAVKALALHTDDEPKPKARRREDGESDFSKLVRRFSRHLVDTRKEFKDGGAITSRTVVIPAEAYEIATRYCQTCSINSVSWNDNTGSDFDHGIDVSQNYICLHL
jgi:hypothetical protein